MEPVVSIVIPCYNGELYIEDTLTSILSQEGVEFEVIIIDDGSTDKTAKKINGFKDTRIKYFYQINAGVSRARNVGFKKTRGEFVIFFDSDDIMPRDFILSRVVKMKLNKEIDFLSGNVLKFGETGYFDEVFKGPDGFNFESQILLYDQHVVTCPSNFIFKTEFLKKNKLDFPIVLSSTADRYYLLMCKKFGQVGFFEDIVPLHYRVTRNSMSNNMSINLVRDNEKYYKLLKENYLIPKEIKNNSLFLGDYILFGSYWKTGIKLKSLKFAVKCFCRNPASFFKKILN